MGISLKNHEDRIKVLENQSQTTGARFVQLGYNWNGFSGNFSEPISNFDLVEFLFVNGNGTVYTSNTYLTKTLLKYPDKRTTLGTNDAATYHGSVNDRSVTYIWRMDMQLIGVYGLKLYYSFSYNIIYRATHLLEKIMSQTKEVLAL